MKAVFSMTKIKKKNIFIVFPLFFFLQICPRIFLLSIPILEILLIHTIVPLFIGYGIAYLICGLIMGITYTLIYMRLSKEKMWYKTMFGYSL